MYGKVARPPVQYGERERPERRSIGLLIGAQVAHAPRTVPLAVPYTHLQSALSAFWDALCLQPEGWDDELFQDLRFGAWMLTKNPGFTFVAALTLALGIGANTAVFILLDASLFRALPVKDPQRLVFVQRVFSGNRSETIFPPRPLSGCVS